METQEEMVKWRCVKLLQELDPEALLDAMKKTNAHSTLELKALDAAEAMLDIVEKKL